MLAAIAAARDAARGHEALAVSHQLPIWTARSFATGRRLWHDPRKRQCSLASLTSFTYDGDELVSVSYEEPARDLLPVPAPAPARSSSPGPDDAPSPRPARPHRRRAGRGCPAGADVLTGCSGGSAAAVAGPGLRLRRRDGHPGRGGRPQGPGAVRPARRWTGSRSTCGTTAVRSSWSTSGGPGARRASPRRRRCRRCTSRPRPTACSSSASTPRTVRRRRGPTRSGSASPTRASTTTAAGCCSPCAARCRRRPSRRRWCSTARAGWPRGSSARSTRTRARRARRRRPRRGEVVSVGGTISDGSLLLALPLAVAAGLVSFLSPCVLPLVPGYLAYTTGLSASEVFDEAPRRRGRLVSGALLFVAGFTLVFVSAGVLLGGFGGFLLENQDDAAARARRHHDRAGAGVHRVPAVDAARRAAGPQARRRAGRRAGARHAVRSGLDAVHRADPRRGDGPRPRRGHGAARRRARRGVLPRPRPAVRADRARVQPGDDDVRLGQEALRRDHAHRRRRCSSSSACCW